MMKIGNKIQIKCPHCNNYYSAKIIDMWKDNIDEWIQLFRTTHLKCDDLEEEHFIIVPKHMIEELNNE